MNTGFIALAVVVFLIALCIWGASTIQIAKSRPKVRRGGRQIHIHGTTIRVNGQTKVRREGFLGDTDALAADFERLVGGGKVSVHFGDGGDVQVPTGKAGSVDVQVPTGKAGGSQKKPAQGMWECEYCTTENEAKVPRCVSCGAPRKGVQEQPVIDKTDFSDLIQSLRACDFDGPRVQVLESLRGNSYTSEQVVAVLMTFDFDGPRADALKVLRGTITAPVRKARILQTFDFDGPRSEAARLLVPPKALYRFGKEM